MIPRAVDYGISQPTAKVWLSVLQASGLVYLLKPHCANFGKRLVKAPKLYWNDTGLLCYLLRIADPQELTTHPFKGPIIERYAVGKCVKVISNSGGISEPFFRRDSNGREVDLLVDRGSRIDALEVKSSETIRDAYFAGLRTYRGIAGDRQQTKPSRAPATRGVAHPNSTRTASPIDDTPVHFPPASVSPSRVFAGTGCCQNAHIVTYLSDAAIRLE